MKHVQPENVASGPLAGITVVDLTSTVMGPYGTSILADMGADVIKVEAPEGDVMRHIGKGRSPAMGPIFMAVNRNKRSLALDLKKPGAQAALKKILANTDVLVHSMRPAAIKKLGFDYASVCAVRADIIYCGAYGYGSAGPYASRPAYDDTIQGMTGMCALNTALAGEPRFAPTIIADKMPGLMLSNAVLGALVHRQRSGQGQSIELPMFETLISFLMVEHLWERMFDPEQGQAGYPRVLSQLRRPHKTQDGYLCVLPYTDRHWRDFFSLARREDMNADPKFQTMNARLENFHELYSIMAALMATQASAVWMARFDEADIPYAPVNEIADLFADPHVEAVDLFFKSQHPTEGEITQVRSPLTYSATPVNYRRHPPRLGENSREILAEHGLAQDEIDRLLRESGIRDQESGIRDQESGIRKD